MNVKLDIERRLLLPIDHFRALRLLDDLEGTIGRFPNLKKLTRLDDDSYLWEMRTMGVRIAKIAHDLSYAARYEIDRDAGAIRWQPLPGHGNARIGGEIRLAEKGAQTEMLFKVEGVMNDVPVPLLYRPLAGPFIVNKMTTLIERFLARTGETLTMTLPVKTFPKKKPHEYC